MKMVMELATVATENDSAVLLQGDTGTGKGVLAKWIHEHGSRRTGPFVEINCSSLKGDLLSSELFGHVKGAFTSAIQDRQGLMR
jgi:transcriptional regulator with GAF, ATPase, and Fis domain